MAILPKDHCLIYTSFYSGMTTPLACSSKVVRKIPPADANLHSARPPPTLQVECSPADLFHRVYMAALQALQQSLAQQYASHTISATASFSSLSL